MELEKLQSAKKLFFIMLSIDIAVTAINAISTFWAIGILNDIQSGIRIADQSLLGTLGFWDSFAWLMLLTIIGVGIGLIKWLSACYQFAKDALRATGFKQESWIGLGWIFPIFNLFKPYQVINEIYKVGSPAYRSGDDWKKEDASGWLLTWWVFWAVTHFFMWIIGKEMFKKSLKDDLTLNQIMGAYDIQAWSCVISIVIAGLWFVVANHLTGRLIARSAINSTPQQPIFTNSVPVQKTPSVGQTTITARAASINTKEAAMNQQLPMNANTSIAIESSQQTMQEIEDRLYEQIAQEVETNTVDKGIWTKAYAQTGGDDKQTRVLYIKFRFDRLMAAENARLEAIQREREEVARREQELRDREHEKIESLRKLVTSVEWFDFQHCCKWGFIDEVKESVDKNPLLLAIATESGNTALHLAVTDKQQEVVMYLADKGASVSVRNRDGETPIDIAMRTGQAEVAEFLQRFSE